MGVSVHTGGNPICKVVLIPGWRNYTILEQFQLVWYCTCDFRNVTPSTSVYTFNVSGCYLNLTLSYLFQINPFIASHDHLQDIKLLVFRRYPQHPCDGDWHLELQRRLDEHLWVGFDIFMRLNSGPVWMFLADGWCIKFSIFLIFCVHHPDFFQI